MQPDLELVQVRDDQSFKVWSHGYPFRTVRWHFHPEYELHLVTSTRGLRYVGDDIGPFDVGDLVLVGPNLPHNWISEVPSGETIEERCLVLQFTSDFIDGLLSLVPELRFLKPLMTEAFRGVRFPPQVAAKVGPQMRELLDAEGARRVTLLMEVLDVLGHAEDRVPLASIGFRPDPSAYLSTTMNLVLQHIDRNLTSDLNETALARLSGQSVSAFSRCFRKSTGINFVKYVNSLRIELACQHLSQTDSSVAEICFEVGFNNVSNFNRQFLAMKGMPPSRFRNLRRDSVRLTPAA